MPSHVTANPRATHLIMAHMLFWNKTLQVESLECV